MSKQNSDLLCRQETTEIELSGEDVIRLSAQPATPSEATPRPFTRVMWRWRVAIACAGAVSIAAIAAGIRDGAFHGSAANQVPPAIAQPKAVESEVPAPVVDTAPVRVQNPFDKSEVFEFPAGTSEQDARDKVADLLMQRAVERQALYDAQHPRKRKAKKSNVENP